MIIPQPRPFLTKIPTYLLRNPPLPKVKQIIYLSSNESALGPSPKATAAYQKASQKIHRYSDRNAWHLCEALAHHYKLDSDRIICGNGSDELLYLIAQAYAGPGDEVIHSSHSFLLYSIVASSVGAIPIAVPERQLTITIEDILAHVTSRTRIIFLANPNNPTGQYLNRTQLHQLHKELRDDILLVIDAAYAEFVSVSDYCDGHELARDTENVVMTRTFSKIYGLAGLRLGWAYGPARVITILQRLRSPFNVNTAAQITGIAALEDQAHVKTAQKHNEIYRPWLSDQLTSLGLTVLPSVANFLLVSFAELENPHHTVPKIRQALYDQGILVRLMEDYGLPEYVRVSIGSQQELIFFVETLAKIMTEMGLLLR